MPSLIQSIDYAAIAPPLIVAVTAVVVLVADLFLPPQRKGLLAWVTALGLLGALRAALPLRGETRETFCLPSDGGGEVCSYVANDLTLVFQALVLLAAVVVVLMSARTVVEERIPAGEFWFLLLCSTAGATSIAAARDLVTLIVSLELVSLPAFALVATRRYDPRGGEGAVKFFLVSVVATAVMLYGASLVYGLTGSVHLARIAETLGDPASRPAAVAVGVVLTLVGLAFKVAAVPFHGWLPDTYTGAPIPVAAYLSVVSKAAGFVGLILVVGLAFGPYVDTWAPVAAVLAALTMTVGNLVALRQRHAVRLLAWSSIAHSGFILVPLGAAAGSRAEIGDTLAASIAYLIAYAVMNLGAFAIVVHVGRERPANRLVDYRGLIRTQPMIAVTLAFFLACLAGLPPGLIGLWAKVVVFQAAVAGGVGWLAVIMAINTVIALYYYAVWAGLLFATPDPAAPPPAYRAAAGVGSAIWATLGVAVVLSILPQIVLQVLVRQAALIG